MESAPLTDTKHQEEYPEASDRTNERASNIDFKGKQRRTKERRAKWDPKKFNSYVPANI